MKDQPVVQALVMFTVTGAAALLGLIVAASAADPNQGVLSAAVCVLAGLWAGLKVVHGMGETSARRHQVIVYEVAGRTYRVPVAAPRTVTR